MIYGERDPHYAYPDRQTARTYSQDELDAAVAAERERWRGMVRGHLHLSTMSIYGTQAECKAARDALERLLDDGA